MLAEIQWKSWRLRRSVKKREDLTGPGRDVFSFKQSFKFDRFLNKADIKLDIIFSTNVKPHTSDFLQRLSETSCSGLVNMVLTPSIRSRKPVAFNDNVNLVSSVR